jgi:hypothetical protein
MKKIIYTKEEIDNVINLYVNECLGSHLIEIKTGMNRNSILRLLKENNIELRNSGRQFIGGRSVADKKWRDNNKNYVSNKHKSWSENNKVHLKEYHKQWRTDNYEKWKETKRTYEKNRKSSDPLYKLIGNFRTAIYTVLKENNVKKYGHYFEILGYTQNDLIVHLEKQFQNGISWDNYGEWHVDHIKPISLFNFKSTDDDEFKECWSLNNLQPMWGNENISKSDNYDS